MSKTFIERALDLAKRTGSRIVLAFDPIIDPSKLQPEAERLKQRDEVRARAEGLLAGLRDAVAGVKLGLPAMLALGPYELQRLVAPFKRDYFFVCDLKLADIGHVNRIAAEHVFEMGFDALIVHAFIGVRQGIDEVVKLAGEKERGVLAVCAMTHPGASEHMNRHFGKLTALAVSAGVDGFVLPATFPRLITQVRKKYPRALIFSPGVGAQGAPFGSAVRAGADFEIIGRAIHASPEPAKRAREIAEMVKW